MPDIRSRPSPLVLTRKEVAKILRVCERTIVRHEAAGTFPIQRLPGRRVRYLTVAVERYLSGRVA